MSQCGAEAVLWAGGLRGPAATDPFEGRLAVALAERVDGQVAVQRDRRDPHPLGEPGAVDDLAGRLRRPARRAPTRGPGDRA